MFPPVGLGTSPSHAAGYAKRGEDGSQNRDDELNDVLDEVGTHPFPLPFHFVREGSRVTGLSEKYADNLFHLFDLFNFETFRSVFLSLISPHPSPLPLEGRGMLGVLLCTP